MAMAEWVKTIGMSTHLAVATFLRWLGHCPIRAARVQLLMWVVRTLSYWSSLIPIIDVASLRLVLIAYGQQQDMMMEVDI